MKVLNMPKSGRAKCDTPGCDRTDAFAWLNDGWRCPKCMQNYIDNTNKQSEQLFIKENAINN